jgi:hypothetical protein
MIPEVPAVAIPVVELLQVPPDVPSVSVVVCPTHKVDDPVIEESIATLILVVDLQDEPRV